MGNFFAGWFLGLPIANHLHPLHQPHSPHIADERVLFAECFEPLAQVSAYFLHVVR
jgi:hypothetical protein